MYDQQSSSVSVQNQSESWFYRLFGEEFGPVSTDALVTLFESGTLGHDDNVRNATDSIWSPASDVINSIRMGDFSKSSIGVSSISSDSQLFEGMDLDELADANEIQEPTSKADDWYYRIGDRVFGPNSFDRLLEIAQSGKLAQNDEVKLGQDGRWRRVGSMGRLMVVLPTQAKQHKIIPKQKSSPTVNVVVEGSANPGNESRVVGRASIESAVNVQDSTALRGSSDSFADGFEKAKTEAVRMLVAKAEESYRQAEVQAKAELQWALAPGVVPFWWGYMNGVQFGPVDFMQLYAFAREGRLKPTDYLRNGEYGQYAVANTVPGLFQAVAIVSRAADTLKLAKEQATTLANLIADASKTDLTTPTPISKLTTALPSVAGSNPSIATKTELVQSGTPSVSRSGSNPEIASPPSSQISPAANSVGARNSNADSKPSRQTPSREIPVRQSSDSISVPTPLRPSSAEVASVASTSRPSAPTSYPSMATRLPTKSPTPARRKSTSEGFDFSGLIGSTTGKVGLGLLVAVGLYCGSLLMPGMRGADIKHYQALQQILDDVRAKRSQNASDFTEVKVRAEKVAKDVVAAVKKRANIDDPAALHLLRGARDDIPRMIQRGLDKESPAEKSLEMNLWGCAKSLGVKSNFTPPPPAPESDEQA